MLVLALARVASAFHQTICCAFATVVTLLAPGVPNLYQEAFQEEFNIKDHLHLMGVPLVILTFLGAQLPGALDHPSTQTAAAVALILPPDQVKHTQGL